MPDLTLAAAQFIARQRDVPHNVRRHVRLTSLAADHGAQLVVFPELSLTSYDLRVTSDDALSPDDPRLTPLAQIARERNVVVVAGAPVAGPNGLCIGAIVYHADGRATTHLKQYPTATEQTTFVPGPGGATLALGGELVGLAICADVTHAAHARDAASRGATVYAAGALFSVEDYATDAAHLQRRAMDHAMLVLLANYGAPAGGYVSAGRSAAWSTSGELLASAPPDGEALVLAERTHAGWTAKMVACPG
jgi:predicted amidohydrolase